MQLGRSPDTGMCANGNQLQWAQSEDTEITDRDMADMPDRAADYLFSDRPNLDKKRALWGYARFPPTQLQQ